MDNVSYKSYDYGDDLIPGDEIKINHSVVTNDLTYDLISKLGLNKTVEELDEMRDKSVDAEHIIFEKLQNMAKEWERQAALTQSINSLLDYLKAPAVKHTSNTWKGRDGSSTESEEISNAVYKMSWFIHTNTKYDRETKTSVPVAWYVSWSVNVHQIYGNNFVSSKEIDGQNRKRFTDEAAAKKYIQGRINAYAYLFEEISPPIPEQYKTCFMVNGLLLPGYTIKESIDETQGKDED